MDETMGQKRNHILISSSSSADDEEEEEDESQSESESESEGYIGNESSFSTSCDDDEDDDDDDESVIELTEDGAPKCAGDANNVKPLWIRVVCRLQDSGDLRELSLLECRSYLQHHGLRSTGTKAECTQRVMGHWRLKDGNAEVVYPPSSFAIDCTGDVCRGDIILFKQRAFKKGQRKRRERYPGKITVAGRVVRESYGAGTQQHTFTIEVLWSKGINELPLLSLRLVKGRKLYKYKTFRQPWENESDRIKILAEKHERGAAARLVRAMTKAERASSKNKGVKRQKHCLPERRPRPGKKAGPRRENRQKAVPEHTKSNDPPRRLPPVGREKSKRSSKARAPDSSGKLKNFTRPYDSHGLPTAPSYVYPPQNFHQYQMHPAVQPYPHHPHGFHHSRGQFHQHPWNAAPCFPHPSSSSHHVGPPVIPQHRSLNHAHYPSYEFESRNANPLMNLYGFVRPFDVTRY